MPGTVPELEVVSHAQTESARDNGKSQNGHITLQVSHNYFPNEQKYKLHNDKLSF